MKYKLSDHARKKHADERWNAVTILDNLDDLKDGEFLEGQTCDVYYGYIDGECVGMILSKERNSEVVIITGFSAPKEYWKSV